MKFWPTFLFVCTIMALAGTSMSRMQTLKATDAATNTHDKQRKAVQVPDNTKVQVYGIRKFPYPYQAMLAISSDADHQTLRKFNLVHEFLNTKNITPMGHGLGLDVSDSFFMYNGSDIIADTDYGKVPLRDELAYFKGVTSKKKDGDIIDFYIAAGWMDSMHTFGDFSMVNECKTRFQRGLAKQAITVLKDAGDNVSVWIDHGNASNVDNFGSYGIRPFYHYQKGATPHTAYYHTDLTLPYGIQFVWPDQNSHIFSHDTMVYPLHLPDGRSVWGFWRYTDKGRSNKGIEWLWSPEALQQEITSQNLSSIVKHHQYAVIAQHLCGASELLPLGPNAIQALRRLANEYYEGKILVTRTSRLLRYNVTNEYVKYRVETMKDGMSKIHITSVDDPVLGEHVPTIQELRGITFYTSNPSRTQLEIGNQPIEQSFIEYHESDGKSPSVGVKWFPVDISNYIEYTRGLYQPKN